MPEVQEAFGIIDDIINGVREAINQALGPVFDAIHNVIASISAKVDGIINAVNDSLSAFSSALIAAVEQRLASIGDAIQTVIDEVLKPILDTLARIQDTIVSILEVLYDSIVESVKRLIEQFESTLQAVVTELRTAIETVVGAFRSALADTLNAIAQQLRNIYDTVTSVVSNVVRTVGDWLGSAIAAIQNAISNVVQAAAGFIKQSQEFIGNVIVNIQQQVARVTEALRTMLEQLLTEIHKRLADIKELIETQVVKPLEAWWFDQSNELRKLKESYDAFILQPILQNPQVPAVLKRMLSNSSGSAWLFQAIAEFFVTPILAASIVTQIYAGQLELMRQASYAASGAGILSVTNVVEATNRGFMSRDSALSEIAREGLDARDFDILNALYQRYINIADEIALYRRDLVDENTLRKDLSEQGFSERRIDMLLQATEYLPNIPDLIRMAVREVFSPEIAEKFGQYEDFPSTFAEHAAKLGMSEDWAKAYWAAHWELPSAGQGFEMFQRGIITRDELVMLLRALDVMPFWRDKLIELAYNPLTRVDIRRMHKLGILDRDQVYRAYLDIGYDPTRAEWLTQFTEKLNAEEAKQEKVADRELTRSQIERAYKSKMLDFDTAAQLLKDIGYDDFEVAFMLTMIDWQLAADARDRRVDIIEKKYKAGVIDIAEVWDELSQLNLTADEMQLIRDKLELETIREPKTPSLADLSAFLKNGVIGLEEYVDELQRLGYSEKTALRYLANMLKSKAIKAPKEGESGYAIAVRALNVIGV